MTRRLTEPFDETDENLRCDACGEWAVPGNPWILYGYAEVSCGKCGAVFSIQNNDNIITITLMEVQRFQGVGAGSSRGVGSGAKRDSQHIPRRGTDRMKPDPDKLNRALEAAAREGLTERDFVALAALCLDQVVGELSYAGKQGRRVTTFGFLAMELDNEANRDQIYRGEDD